MFSFDEVLNAHYKACSNKLYRDEIYLFERDLFENIQNIYKKLISNTYKFGPYKQFMKTDTKRRLIVNCPYQDRIVHWLLYERLYPVFDKSFIFDSYANRLGKGTIKGANRAQFFIRKPHLKYVLKIDFSKYFYSVHHEIMLQEIFKKVNEPSLRSLIKNLIYSYKTPNTFDHLFDKQSPYHQTDNKGMPIGSLFSQLMANIYLNRLDHYIKDFLRIKYYIRYVDDLVIIGESKQDLWHKLDLIRNFCYSKLALEIHPYKISLFPKYKGLDFLGYRIYPYKKLIRKSTQKKLRKAVILRDRKAIASYNGVAKYSDSHLAYICKSWLQ